MKKQYKKLLGLGSIYFMFCIICGTGALLIQAKDLTDKNIMEMLEIPLLTTNISMIQERDNLYDIEDREETLEEVQDSLQPVYKDVFVKIKEDGVESLNIRKSNTKESESVGVLYQGELIQATLPYVNDEVQTEEWIKVETGYVHSDFVDIVDEEIDLTEYRMTAKQTYTKNPIITPYVSQKSYISVEDLQKVTKDTGLEGIESAIVSAEENYDINGLFIYAVARLESGHGTSQLAQEKNNLFGMNAQDHDPYNLAFSYDSFHESVFDFASRIKSFYIDKGLDTVSLINTRYSTDPEWHSKVFSIMTEAYYTIIN